jgi:hypothetical protein
MSRLVDQLSTDLVSVGAILIIMTVPTGPYLFQVERVDAAKNQLVGRIVTPQSEIGNSTRGSIRADIKQGDVLQFTADPELEASLGPNATASWKTSAVIDQIRIGH